MEGTVQADIYPCRKKLGFLQSDGVDIPVILTSQYSAAIAKNGLQIRYQGSTIRHYFQDLSGRHKLQSCICHEERDRAGFTSGIQKDSLLI